MLLHQLGQHLVLLLELLFEGSDLAIFDFLAGLVAFAVLLEGSSPVLKELTLPAIEQVRRDVELVADVGNRLLLQEMAPEETGPGFSILAGEFLNDVVRAQNLVVLKTSPGHANSVAVALDNEEWPEIVGTIAGDDTILVITPDAPTAEAIQEKLLELLEG